MNIGSFALKNGQLIGSIATLTVDLARLGLRPVESDNEKAPAFEIMALNVARKWVGCHSPHTEPPSPVSRRRTPGCSIKSCLRPSCASQSALAGFCLLVADSQRGSASSARPQRDVF